MRTLKSLCLATALLLFPIGCFSSEQPKYTPGGPYYFKSWANYYQPFRPIDEIDFNNAKELEQQGYSYYIAFFYKNGQIKSFEKRYKGKSLFKVEYFYEGGVIKKEEIRDENGEIKVRFYDKNGNRIKP